MNGAPSAQVSHRSRRTRALQQLRGAWVDVRTLGRGERENGLQAVLFGGSRWEETTAKTGRVSHLGRDQPRQVRGRALELAAIAPADPPRRRPIGVQVGG